MLSGKTKTIKPTFKTISTSAKTPKFRKTAGLPAVEAAQASGSALLLFCGVIRSFYVVFFTFHSPFGRLPDGWPALASAFALSLVFARAGGVAAVFIHLPLPEQVVVA